MTDRKELTRQYKETPRPMGVYRVQNPRTGTALVAASLDLPAMLNRHRTQLKFGGHPTAALQKEWKEDGGADWVFEVLDTLPPAESSDTDPIRELIMLEDLWLDKLGLSLDKMHSIRNRVRRA